ncbi:sigma-54-dependent transcriptional regulator [Pontivivens insulae]|uniref:Nif-specific regulatory protein n=1 Tax=Pontivivens insulae TaxID=1639689 RepID=A0A2R8A6Q8_9RHOB|nr:sigma-54 dependent transcriptional regulator [Pontivivens insulae]RED18027.1 two component Fis family sigma54 specific transcriptional regulator [Pontivivens insulae]SPF27923.1 C4-dicarboxylate transport transcriptional regulatory protein DctD [Pontivivens insulae]
MSASVLFVDDEEHLRIAGRQSLDLAGIEAECFPSATAALERLERGFDGILVTDIRMQGMDGIELMREARTLDPDLPVILVTGHGDVDLAVACIKEGAYDFLEKPCAPARLVACVERALEVRRLTEENRTLRELVASPDVIDARLIGRSDVMRRLRERVAAIAATDADVLVTGDTGTGKEVVARAIHAASGRAERPFVHINCAALPEALIESELFGHEAGAFPGAVRARFGKLEHGNRGTICLDEIDSLPLALQAKLLDVLHNRTVMRLGSNEAIALDIRVVALSKTDLNAAVADGTFRADLLYRLNVLGLALPSLEARREDIPDLFRVLVARAAERYGTAPPVIEPALVGELAAAPWPGNVRELRNAAERLVLGLNVTEHGPEGEERRLADHVASYEKALISAAIHAHGGRLKEVYEALGLSRKGLYDKMQRHGLNRSDFVE